MTLKAELQLWAAALDAYDEDDYQKSLELFCQMEENSKVLTNMGLIFATIGEHETAVHKFIQATNLDPYLAIAYFQCGVSNFLLGRFELAVKDFEEARLYLRGNQDIRYEQLGLKFVLYAAEVLFNQGLSQIYLGRMQEGMRLLNKASSQKVTEEHDVIDEAIQFQGDQYTVFSIPAGVLYRPNENKLRNARAKDYMGKARLIAVSDGLDAHTEFTGATRLKQGISPMGLLLTTPEPASLSPRIRSNTALTPSAALSQTLQVQSIEKQQLILARRPRTSTTVARPKSSGDDSTKEPSIYARSMSDRGEVPDRYQRSAPNTRRITNGAGQEQDHFGSQRHTAYYHEYFDSYGANSPTSSVDSRSSTKSKTGFHGSPPQSARSRNAPTSYASSLIGRNSSVRGRHSSPLHSKKSRSRASSRSEEEGYASWNEFDDDRPREQSRIRVKLHYRDDIRGMALIPDTTFRDFVQMVRQKFGSVNGLGLKFKDEDGGIISLKDESDYDLAIATACMGGGGALEGRLEIWCADL